MFCILVLYCMPTTNSNLLIKYWIAFQYELYFRLAFLLKILLFITPQGAVTKQNKKGLIRKYSRVGRYSLLLFIVKWKGLPNSFACRIEYATKNSKEWVKKNSYLEEYNVLVHIA